MWEVEVPRIPPKPGWLIPFDELQRSEELWVPSKTKKEKYRTFLSQNFFFYFDTKKIQRVLSRYVFPPLFNLVFHIAFFPPNCTVTILNEGIKLYSWGGGEEI